MRLSPPAPMGHHAGLARLAPGNWLREPPVCGVLVSAPYLGLLALASITSAYKAA